MKLILGDCVDIMQTFDANTIDLTVTSPPYDDMRNYNNTLNWNFDIFKSVANELYRVTKNGGVIVWVVGDQTVDGSETGTSFKQALYFKEIGFALTDTMIYQTSKPPMTHKRYEQEFEYMFIFSKGKVKTFNPIKCRKIHIENKIRNKRWRREKDGSYDEGFISLNTEKIIGNVWYIESGVKNDKISYSHPATFPQQLAHDHIISWSNEGDTVLDPFMGSGTTGVECIKTGRNFIGIEKVQDYYDLSAQRIKETDFKIKLNTTIEKDLW